MSDIFKFRSAILGILLGFYIQDVVALPAECKDVRFKMLKLVIPSGPGTSSMVMSFALKQYLREKYQISMGAEQQAAGLGIQGVMTVVRNGAVAHTPVTVMPYIKGVGPMTSSEKTAATFLPEGSILPQSRFQNIKMIC